MLSRTAKPDNRMIVNGIAYWNAESEEPKIVLYSKLRYVDPDVLQGGKLVKLSELDKGFAERLEMKRELNRKGVRIKEIDGLEIPIPV